ncbi:MAG: sulfatase-like hydrolase/transferase [Bdellovibrionota bacterium]
MSDNKNSSMKQGAKPLALARSVLIFTILLLALYLGIRILFLGWNFVQFRQFTAAELALSFLHGLRFDAVIVVPIVFISVLVLLIPNKFLRFFGLMTMTFGHAALLCGNFIDVELVNFMGRRFTRSSLYLAGEGQNQNMLQYGFLAAATLFGLILFAVICYKMYLKIRLEIVRSTFKNKTISVIMMIPFVIVLGRGGFQLKPISFVDAKILSHNYSHHLVLNTSFTFLKSFGKTSFKREKYFSETELLKYLNPAQTTKKNEAQKASGYNLVIFIVESLSKEYLSPKRTPYFAELIKKGVYFDKSYANGRRSIEGIASILAGIPALMEEPFLNSEFATNEFMGLGQLFKKQKYNTSFFHGAKNGTMRFNVFTKASGFDHYFGKNEYPDLSQDDGFWGIYDDPFLQFTCQKMTDFSQPFASVVFTLSSHQPYKVPEDFDKTYLGENNEIPVLKSISYVDHAIKNYMECAKKQAWFDKTIFVFMADHTGPSLDPASSDFEQLFEIPILFYAKNTEILQGLNPNQYAQQIDLFPTINELFNLGYINTNHLARSLYSQGPKTIALYTDQHYELVGDTEKTENHLKAIKQYFSQGLYDNRLYFPQVKGN